MQNQETQNSLFVWFTLHIRTLTPFPPDYSTFMGFCGYFWSVSTGKGLQKYTFKIKVSSGNSENTTLVPSKDVPVLAVERLFCTNSEYDSFSAAIPWAEGFSNFLFAPWCVNSFPLITIVKLLGQPSQKPDQSPNLDRIWARTRHYI